MNGAKVMPSVGTISAMGYERMCDCQSSLDLFLRGQDIARHLEETDSQWRRLGGVWGKHIANVRGQMETAILALAQEFADIVLSLDELAATARWLESNEGRLARVVGESTGGESTGGENRVVVDELARSAGRLEREAANIRANVEAALVHLQFQDRVDQILGHVGANIDALPTALADARGVFARTGRLPPVDFSPLLAAIESSYTTDEERAAHRGRPTATELDEIPYF